jgi:hypothetical protein
MEYRVEGFISSGEYVSISGKKWTLGPFNEKDACDIAREFDRHYAVQAWHRPELSLVQPNKKRR